jgi:hypothetical protein
VIVGPEMARTMAVPCEETLATRYAFVELFVGAGGAAVWIDDDEAGPLPPRLRTATATLAATMIAMATMATTMARLVVYHAAALAGFASRLRSGSESNTTPVVAVAAAAFHSSSGNSS